MKVPFLDLPQQHGNLKNEILSVWSGLLDSATFIGGDQVDQFEVEFARACDTKHCISVGSGTDALRLIFIALGLKKGDEIITVPNTFIATTEAITQAGGEIVFCDVDPVSYNIDTSQIEEKITSRTVGIVPVHLYGQPAEMDTINAIAKKHGLWAVEDSCQAHLAKYKGRKTGGLANAAAFSFYPGKNLGACGEAGAITTDDPNLAVQLKALRNHGQADKYYHDTEGYNSRCDSLQASALRIKLPYLARWCRQRREKAAYYNEHLQEINAILPVTGPGNQHVFHLYVIQVENRKKVIEHLASKNIATGLHYPLPLHQQKAYGYLHLNEGSFPTSEFIAKKLLSLPLFPEITIKQIDYVCDTLKEIL